MFYVLFLIMNTMRLFWATVISTVFFTWPVICKWSGLPPTIAVLIITIGSVAVAAIMTLITPDTSLEGVNKFRVIVLVLIGTLNGYCVFKYTEISSSKEVPASIFMIIVSVCGVIVSLLADKFLNGAQITVRHIIGALLAISAIYVLSK